VLPDGAVVPILQSDEKGPTTMKTRLAIAALVTLELACAPFAAEALRFFCGTCNLAKTGRATPL
jgi:hypothetical protein